MEKRKRKYTWLWLEAADFCAIRSEAVAYKVPGSLEIKVDHCQYPLNVSSFDLLCLICYTISVAHCVASEWIDGSCGCIYAPLFPLLLLLSASDLFRFNCKFFLVNFRSVR